MTRHLTTIMSFMTLGLFINCGGSTTAPREGIEANSPSTKNTCSEKIGNCQASQPPTVSPLASYMIRPDDLKSLLPIVLPYEEPETSQSSITTYSPFNAARSAIEENSNQIMALKDLIPGRSVEVSIIQDDSLNATANGWKQVVINSGAISHTTDKELLSVICHELAHSARNHSSATMKFLSLDPNAATLWNNHNKSGNAYLTKTYSISKGTYTHNAALFAAAKVDYEKFRVVFEPHQKHLEAEADAIGAMICGKAGLAISEYNSALASFLSKTGAPPEEGAIEFKDLKDGDIVEIPFDFVWDFVFATSSHPENVERKTQQDLLTTGLANFQDASASLAKTWMQKLSSAKSTISLLQLTSYLPEPKVKILTTEGIPVIMPKKSCGGFPLPTFQPN